MTEKEIRQQARNKQMSEEARARHAVKPYLEMRAEFARRFKSVAASSAARQRTAHKQVKRWEWLTAPSANLNPSHFILETDKNWKVFKPGRVIQRPSAGDQNAARQGYDNSGAVRVIETGGNKREFWQYSPDRIDAITFEDKQPVLIQTLWLKDGYPIAHVFYNRYVMTIRLFDYAGGKVAKVIQSSGLHRKERYLNIKKVWPAEARKFGVWVRSDAAARDVSYRLESAPKRTPASPIPTLNLGHHLKSIEDFITTAVSKFVQKQKTAGPKSQPGDVSCIGLGYCYYVNGGSPWVLVHFDTRKDFEDDGTWTHQEFATLKLPEWEKFWQAYEKADQNGVLIDLHGRKSKTPDSVATYGEMFAEALARASQHNAFKALKRTKSCKLLVHDIDYAFSWKRVMGRNGEGNRSKAGCSIAPVWGGMCPGFDP